MDCSVDVLTLIEDQLRAWLPKGFAIGVAFADEDWPMACGELAVVAHASPRRRAEFVGGRWCAHAALRTIGRPIRLLLPGPLGAPVWPHNTIGSITHDGVYCCAIAGGRGDVAGIDLSLAEHRAAMQELAHMLLSPEEQPGFEQAMNKDAYLHALFCSKEAVVKATSQSAGRFLDLREITVIASAEEFTARVHGRFAMLRNHALALAWMGCGGYKNFCVNGH